MLHISQAACKQDLRCSLLARWRRWAAEVKGLKPNEGLTEFIDWLDARGVKQAAVTNAPKCIPAQPQLALLCESAAPVTP